LEIKDIYWVAGIIEGEGCFYINKHQKSPQTRIEVKMTDKDIINRLQQITKLGLIYHVPTDSTRHKDCYEWRVNKQPDVIGLLMTIYPLMGKRRQAKIRECLEVWKSFQTQRQRPCPKGHEMIGENLVIRYNGYRQCRQCQLEYQKKYYQDHKYD
jgi:hypothetical protein